MTSMPSAVITAGTTPPPAQGGTGQAGAVTSGFAVALAQLAAQLGLPVALEQGVSALPTQASLAPTGKLGSLTGDLGAQDGSPDRLTMELLSLLAQDPAALLRLLAQQAQASLSGNQPSLSVAAVGAQQTEASANASGWGALAAQRLASLMGQPTAGLMESGKEAKESGLSASAGTIAALGSKSAQVAAYSELGGTDVDASNASGQQSNAGSLTMAPAYLAAALRAAQAAGQANATTGSTGPNVGASRPADGKETAGGEVLLPFGATVSAVAPREVTPQAVSEPVVLSPLENKGWQELANRIHMTFVEGRTEARIHLWPPELGRVEVRLVLDGQQVGVQLGANSAKAQDLIQANIPQLRSALTEQGLKVGDLSVVLDQFGLASQNMAQHGQAGSWMTGRAAPTPWFDEEPEEVAKAGPMAAGGVDAVGWRTDALVDFRA